MNFKTILLQLIACCAFYGLQAQKIKKGGSFDNPWTEDVSPIGVNGLPEKNLTNHGAYLYQDTQALSTNLEFGKWMLRSRYGYFRETHVTADTLDFRTIKIGTNNRIQRKVRYINTISFSGKDPVGNRFHGRFSFTDSLFEKFETHGLVFTKQENYQGVCFGKTATGYILSSTGDSVLFYLGINFSNPTPDAEVEFLINTSKGSIKIKPLFFSEIPKFNIGRQKYKGFQFEKDGAVVGGAEIKNGFMNFGVYKFWIREDLDINTKQIIVGLLFVIVGFF